MRQYAYYCTICKLWTLTSFYILLCLLMHIIFLMQIMVACYAHYNHGRQSVREFLPRSGLPGVSQKFPAYNIIREYKSNLIIIIYRFLFLYYNIIMLQKLNVLQEMLEWSFVQAVWCL